MAPDGGAFANPEVIEGFEAAAAEIPNPGLAEGDAPKERGVDFGGSFEIGVILNEELDDNPKEGVAGLLGVTVLETGVAENPDFGEAIGMTGSTIF